jgi:hypothetical protein
MSDWQPQAASAVLRARGDAAAWGYRPGGRLSAEPTALAALALLAFDPEGDATQKACRRAADWLADAARADGSVGVTDQPFTPGWPTSYAILVWQSLAVHHDAQRRAMNWLLTQQGITFEKPPGSPLGHDTMLPGWTYVSETQAVLALRRGGHADHVRVQQGLSLIRNRVIPEGGWNFGNNVVFGTSLRPKPGPTGWALLALLGTQNADMAVERSLDYLRETLPRVRSGPSLGLGTLALLGWNAAPAEVDGWLAAAARDAENRPDACWNLVHLLLGSSLRTLGLLGLSPARGESRG